MSHIGTYSNSKNSEEQVQALYDILDDTQTTIRVAPGITNRVIDIAHHIAPGDKSAHLSITIERGSSVHIVMRGKEVLRSCVLECILGDDATVFYEANHMVHTSSLNVVTATLGVGSKFLVSERIYADDIFYSRCNVQLQGEGASFKDEVRYHGNGSALLNMERMVCHTAPRTASNLDTRGVVEGQAQAVWRGTVRVEKRARNASAFQRHDALLASTTAHVDAAPFLEIFTHDVSCKHSASVQRMQPEHLFYLESRGVSEGEARKLLMEGFLS